MTVNRFNGQRGTANSDSRSQQSTQKHMKWMHLSGNGDQAPFLFAVTLPSASLKRKSCCSIVNTDAILCQYRGSNIRFCFLFTFVLTLVGWIYHS